MHLQKCASSVINSENLGWMYITEINRTHLIFVDYLLCLNIYTCLRYGPFAGQDKHSPYLYGPYHLERSSYLNIYKYYILKVDVQWLWEQIEEYNLVWEVRKSISETAIFIKHSKDSSSYLDEKGDFYTEGKACTKSLKAWWNWQSNKEPVLKWCAKAGEIKSQVL